LTKTIDITTGIEAAAAQFAKFAEEIAAQFTLSESQPFSGIMGADRVVIMVTTTAFSSFTVPRKCRLVGYIANSVSQLTLNNDPGAYLGASAGVRDLPEMVAIGPTNTFYFPDRLLNVGDTLYARSTSSAYGTYLYLRSVN
jgi:hypothetical protein